MTNNFFANIQFFCQKKFYYFCVIFILTYMILSQHTLNEVNMEYLSQVATLKTWNIVLMAIVVLMGVVVTIVLFFYKKNRKLHKKMLKEIDDNQQANYEISQMLAEKMQEMEQQARDLFETSAELQWQTESALRLYEEVESQKKEITDSIQYALRIQTILLPEESSINEILNDYFILFRPRDIVSGDFYWVNAKLNKTVVVVADCTGHGVPGAFMSLLGITFLNSIVRDDNLQADMVLNQMREQVITSLRQTGKELENKDGMDLAMCIIDWENSRIEYAGANISLLLLRKTEDNPHEMTEIRADRMPIGIYEQVVNDFTRHTIPIMPGDAIYMLTDGYCDQFGGPELKKFKKKNLIKLLSEIHKLSMTEQRKRLKRNLDKWRGDLPQVDDILMLGIKI